MRPSLERLAAAYHATAWVLGREAAALLPDRRPRRRVAARPVEPPGGDDRGRPRRGRARARPRRPRRPAGGRRSGGDRRDGPRRGGGGLPAARRATGRPRRGRRLDRRAAAARRPPATGCADAGERRARSGAGRGRRPGRRPERSPVRATGARGRPAVLGGRRAPGRSSRPTIETLRARGEPASYERLLGEILVGLDRAGQLRRLATADLGESVDPVEHLHALIRDTLAAAVAAPPHRDRARPLVAGRPGRPRRRRGAARRPGRVGRLQPAVDRRARSPRPRSTSGWRRCSPATTWPTTRSSGPASTSYREPGQHARPDRHRRRPPASQPGAHGPARDDRDGRPSAAA